MITFRSREFMYQNPVALGALLGAVALCAVLMLADGGEAIGATRPWWVVASIAIVVLLLLATPMTITADDTSVRISLAGIFKRSVALEDVVAIEVREYRPLREFGGWGWRKASGTPNTMAYTTRGNSAVVLTLDDHSEAYLGVDDEQGMLAALTPRIGANR